MGQTFPFSPMAVYKDKVSVPGAFGCRSWKIQQEGEQASQEEKSGRSSAAGRKKKRGRGSMKNRRDGAGE